MFVTGVQTCAPSDLLICSHSFLLAAMGYDRYVAICDPLRYTVLMGHGVCMGLVAASCACGFMVAQTITSLVFHLPFHSSNQLHHFFCDISPVLKVASYHTHFSQIVIIMLCAFQGAPSTMNNSPQVM